MFFVVARRQRIVVAYTKMHNINLSAQYKIHDKCFIFQIISIEQMNKKKTDKVSFPTVIKPNENSKNYTSKSNLKARDIQDKNIYFQMPSIHHNDITMKTFLEGQDLHLKRYQFKMLKMYQNIKEAKMTEEWQLYMRKSQIFNTRSTEFYEVEEFLVKSLLKLAMKMNDSQFMNSSSINKTTRLLNGNQESFAVSAFPDNTKLLPQEKSQMKMFLNRSSIYDKSKEQVSAVKEDLSINHFNMLAQQTVILDKKVQLYEKRIVELEATLSKFQQKQKQNSGETDLNNQVIALTIIKNKFKHDSEVKSLQIETLSRQLYLNKEMNDNIRGKLDQLEQSYNQCLKENKQLKEYLKYKQLWAMATEETYTWRALFRQQKEEVARSVGKIKMLKDKNKQLLNYFNMSNVVNPDQQQDKQDLDRIIKQFKEWLQIMSVPKVNYNNTPSFQQNKEQGPKESMGNTEIDVRSLRPNFYIYFQAYENTLLMEKNIINIRPIQYNFFLKLRVIFDSMFTAFQVANSYKEYPSFPEHVIGFLQKFQLNSATNTLEYRKKPIQSEQKVTFLVNLFNKNFCNTWQCDIFKSFLFEQYTLDEIYFFLDCRNEINSGINTCHLLGAPDPISYVKLSKALKVVIKKLAPYENYIIERVKNIIKSKKSVKYGEAFVDKNFVLKLLLEVYALERSKSERIFESSFKSKMKKSYITFGDFHHFMVKNFNFMSSVQIAQFYRQVYALSSGHITYKAIHYMCGTRGLFIPLLLAKRVTKNNLDQTLGKDMILLDIQNTIGKAAAHFQELGVESMMRVQSSINAFMRQLDWYKQNKGAFYNRLYQEMSNILKMNVLLATKASYEAQQGENIESSEVQEQMINLHTLMHQIDNQVPFLSTKKEKRTKALNMLVRNFKIRIQQSILQFQKVNEEQIEKLREQIQLQDGYKPLQNQQTIQI